MSLINKIIIIISVILFTNCATEPEVPPIVADFSTEFVDGIHNAPVKIKLTNLTKGANKYSWVFKGALEEFSNKKDPVIVYKAPGNYKIQLTATNELNEKKKLIKNITVYENLVANFSFEEAKDFTTPFTIKLKNQSKGCKEYLWAFENGSPAVSSEKNPTVTFKKPGIHKITLTCKNYSITKSTQKDITVLPGLQVSFDYKLDYANNYEVPATITLINNSKKANSYQWKVEGAMVKTSTKKNPTFTFTEIGEYTINLKASNSKESKSYSKKIALTKGDNLLTFKDVKFGINTNKDYGMFFSSSIGKVLKQKEISKTNGHLIDIVFFGFDTSFERNQFISPNNTKNSTFNTIPNATKTTIINSQENSLPIIMSESMFDKIKTGQQFDNIKIIENKNNKLPFNKNITSRIILFKTENGRKGAIKIKRIISVPSHYLLADIKVQKTPI